MKKNSNISLWKKWLSYLYPISLELTRSEQNDYLEVVLSKGRLQLIAGEAIYSWDDLYINFIAAFEAIEIEKKGYKNALILGLGLASVPYILEKKFNLLLEYMAVEYDEEVVFLASKYSLPRLKSSIEVQTRDAEAYVYQCTEKYDLICMDIFDDDLNPPQFETPKFLKAMAELLNPNGTLLYNRLYNTDDDRLLTERFLNNEFKDCFPNCRYAESPGNWVLIHKKK